MIKQWFFCRSGFLLILGFITSHSFGNFILSPYETAHLQSVSIQEQIQLTNKRVQKAPDLSQDLKHLVHTYTETITKCSVDYHTLNDDAVIHALIGVQAYHFAVNAELEEHLVFFEFMSDLERDLSENLDCSLGRRSLANAHTRVHINNIVTFPDSELPEEFEIAEGMTLRLDRLALIDKVKNMDASPVSILRSVSSRKPLW